MSLRLAVAVRSFWDIRGRAFREHYLTEVRAALGEAGFEAALAWGRALTPEQAVLAASED